MYEKVRLRQEIKMSMGVKLSASVMIMAVILNFACAKPDDISAVSKSRSPIKIIYNNDSTNILTCNSPFKKEGQRFDISMLEASVAETAGFGVDVHCLMIGFGWIPWWDSKVYPLDEHYRWAQEEFGGRPNYDILEYVYNGGDIVNPYIKACRKAGQLAFASFRMNDCHHLENALKDKDKRHRDASNHVPKFLADNPDYMLGRGKFGGWRGVPGDYALQEVRDYKFAMLEELFTLYDLDGVELDFLRYVNYFQLCSTTEEQRISIMTNFIRRIRNMLDDTARDGKKRYLMVRIPNFVRAFGDMGIDLVKWTDAGVDLVNVSSYYFTDQQNDLACIRKMIPDTPVFLEMTHTCANGHLVYTDGAYENFNFRRTTQEQFYTTAHLAYNDGADGVSLFNFAYYREWGPRIKGPFNEPPFEIIPRLRDRQRLAQHRNQNYFIGKVFDAPSIPGRQVPCYIAPRLSRTFTLRMAPPAGGWKTDGNLRIQITGEPYTDQAWSVFFNSVPLRESDNVDEPYNTPYIGGIGKQEEYRAWTVPLELMVEGDNRLEVSGRSGKPAEIIYIELAVR